MFGCFILGLFMFIGVLCLLILIGKLIRYKFSLFTFDEYDLEGFKLLGTNLFTGFIAFSSLFLFGCTLYALILCITSLGCFLMEKI